jgi:hypothetical protein
VRGLLDRERREPAVLDPEAWPDGVDAGRLQPFLRPRTELAARGLLERLEQVTELGVAVGVPLEVDAEAGEELLLSDPGDELS